MLYRGIKANSFLRCSRYSRTSTTLHVLVAHFSPFQSNYIRLSYPPTMLRINLPQVGACSFSTLPSLFHTSISHCWHLGLTRLFFCVIWVGQALLPHTLQRTIIPFFSSPTVQSATAFGTETESCFEGKWT